MHLDTVFIVSFCCFCVARTKQGITFAYFSTSSRQRAEPAKTPKNNIIYSTAVPRPTDTVLGPCPNGGRRISIF